MHTNLTSIKNIIRKAAKEELLPRFTQVNSQLKADGSVVTEADLAMQNRLQTELLAHYPDSILLSEEMTEQEQQHALNSDSPVWCLDPLDGTSNFAAGIPYFAISLALLQHGNVIMGLVYDPIRDEFFSATENEPALINNEELKCNQKITDITRAVAIIDFKRLESDLSVRLVQQQPFASQRNFGASALDWCWLAANRGHVYCHGKQNIWDYSAGQFIFEKAGGHCCTLDGEAIFVNRLEGRSVVAGVNKTLFESWRAWIKE
ncbi:MAG: inositol monophosphatase family protein [Gammaproteobacteria bacterium]|nr:inositol monophosphatase family protein [Gammaproteobacteria bacterium]